MLRQTRQSLVRTHFFPVRENWAFPSLRASQVFPLLHNNVLLAKWHRSHENYESDRQFDEDHKGSQNTKKSAELSQHHTWSAWDKHINPQLYTTWTSPKHNVEYLGVKTGRLCVNVGWRRVGGSFKFAQRDRERNFNVWAERKKTPAWSQVPRITAMPYGERWKGRLTHHEVGLSRILWAIDSGHLNRNEVISLWSLTHNHVLYPWELVWPGIKIINDGIKEIKYPLSIELQSASSEVIKMIENAGGEFLATYLSVDGFYQELRPEEFPAFIEQAIPDRQGMDHIAVNPAVRGFLSQWYEEDAKYAHPDAGRRLSHYVRPPHQRDFPATFDEYERTKHSQKWHLGQPGSGTVLPFISERAVESDRRGGHALAEPPEVMHPK